MKLHPWREIFLLGNVLLGLLGNRMQDVWAVAPFAPVSEPIRRMGAAKKLDVANITTKGIPPSPLMILPHFCDHKNNAIKCSYS